MTDTIKFDEKRFEELLYQVNETYNMPIAYMNNKTYKEMPEQSIQELNKIATIVKNNYIEDNKIVIVQYPNNNIKYPELPSITEISDGIAEGFRKFPNQ